MPNYVGAIDQGTTSTRFIVFDRSGRIVSVAQKEHEQIYPKPGWVEHDPEEIWRRTEEVIGDAMAAAGLSRTDLAAIGITNQRETTVVWNRRTGKPVHNAIVWQDTRVAARWRNMPPAADRTATAPEPACRWQPISAVSSCAGFWRMFPARAAGRGRRTAVRQHRHVS